MFSRIYGNDIGYKCLKYHKTLKMSVKFDLLPGKWCKNKTTRGGFSATAVLFSFTVALQRLRLSPLYVYSIMKQAWYNDHQIWIRSFTAEEGIYSNDYCEQAVPRHNPCLGWRMPEHLLHTHTHLFTHTHTHTPMHMHTHGWACVRLCLCFYIQKNTLGFSPAFVWWINFPPCITSY